MQLSPGLLFSKVSFENFANCDKKKKACKIAVEMMSMSMALKKLKQQIS